MIFSIRQLQEKSIEQNRDLFIVFVDFSKAFDSVNRAVLWYTLDRFDYPDVLLQMIKAFHEDATVVVAVGGEVSESVPMNCRTKQGCVLAPILFSIFLAAVTKRTHMRVPAGTNVRSRRDGKLFNIARLRASTKVTHSTITELLYADDAALVAHTWQDMQHLLDAFAEMAVSFGLMVHTEKTEAMYQLSTNPGRHVPSFRVCNADLNFVENFKYLGSKITNDNRVDKEVQYRIQSACVSYAKLKTRLWKRAAVSPGTKCKVYRAVVMPALLYSAETYTL